MKYCWIVLILAWGSGVAIANDSVTSSVEQQSTVPKQPSRNDKMYFFEHKLLPKWLYQSDGVFFEDAKLGVVSRLFSAAHEVVDADFADQLKAKALENSDAILFIFEQPKRVGHCYYAIAQKIGDTYIYTTYEKTLRLNDTEADEKIVGVVGRWAADGKRLNFGGRTYDTAEAFASDILDGTSTQEPQVQWTPRTPPKPQ